VLRAAAALDGSGLLAAEPPWRVTALMRRLCLAARATQGWAPMDTRAVDGAIVLARQEPALGALVHEGFARARLTQVEKMAPAQAHEFARDYVRLTLGVDVTSSLPARISDALTYFEIARALAIIDPDGVTWTHFVPQDESVFITTLTSQPRSPGWGGIVRVATSAGVSSWDAVIANARAVFEADNETSTPAERLEFLIAVHALSTGGNAAAETLLNDVTDAFTAAIDFARANERALHLALAALGERTSAEDSSPPADPASLGAWLFTLLVRQGSSTGLRQTRSGWSSAQEVARQWLDNAYRRLAPDLVQALAHATMQLGDATQLMGIARREAEHNGGNGDRLMVLQVIVAMVELGAPRRIVPPTVLIDDWDTAFPGWSRYELARTMRGRAAEIVDALLAVPFAPRLASAYAGTLDAHAAGDEPLLSVCAAQLPTVDSAAWDTSLRSGEMDLPMLYAALARRGIAVGLSADVRNTLRAFVTNPPPNLWMAGDIAAALMAAFETSEREHLLDQIVGDLMTEADRFSVREHAESAARPFLHASQIRAVLAGRALFDPVRIATRPHVFPALAAFALEQPSDEWIGWLYGLSRAEPALVTRLAPDTRRALLKLVEHQATKRTADQTRAWMIGLAGQLSEATPGAAAEVQAI
jgi:hypothetical protein